MKPHLLGTVSIYNAFSCTSSAGAASICLQKTSESNPGHLALISILMLWSARAWPIARSWYSTLIHFSDPEALSFEAARTGSGFNRFSRAGSGVGFNNLMYSSTTFDFKSSAALQDAVRSPELGASLLLVIGSTGLVITTVTTVLPS